MSTEPQAGTPEYRRAHALCPVCFSGSFETTCVGCIGGRDTNRAICQDCGWKGIVHDRVSKDAEDAERRIAADLCEEHGFMGAARVLRPKRTEEHVTLGEINAMVADLDYTVRPSARQVADAAIQSSRNSLIAKGFALPSDRQ